MIELRDFTLDMFKKRLERREIWLIGGLEATNLRHMDLVLAIHSLVDQDDTKLIDVFVHSHGGETRGMWAITDPLLCQPCPVRTTALGTTMSAGLTIFLAGDYRRVYPHSRLLFHGPLYYSNEWRTVPEANIELDDQRNTAHWMSEFCAQRTAMPVEFWSNIIERGNDRYFSVAEALQLGHAHEIMKPHEHASRKVTWNRHAGPVELTLRRLGTRPLGESNLAQDTAHGAGLAASNDELDHSE